MTKTNHIPICQIIPLLRKEGVRGRIKVSQNPPFSGGHVSHLSFLRESAASTGRSERDFMLDVFKSKNKNPAF
jgi:hypothetical protein